MINNNDAKINYYVTIIASVLGLFLFIGGRSAHLQAATNSTNSTNASCTATLYNTICGAVSFPQITSGSSSTQTCPNVLGCTGSLTRTCSSGSWGPVSGSCQLPPNPAPVIDPTYTIFAPADNV